MLRNVKHAQQGLCRRKVLVQGVVVGGGEVARSILIRTAVR